MISASDVEFTQYGTGAVTRNLQNILLDTPVTPQDYLAPGESLSVDAGPAIRRALASGKPVRFPTELYVVAPDPASHLGGNDYGYCLSVPQDRILILQEGAVIKAKNGIGAWCRVVQIGHADGVRNVRVFGELRIDANVSNISGQGNEHMHGLFLFNAIDCFIERVHSINARGDNIFIGGTDNTKGSERVNIGSIYAAKAGRKNLALQACDQLIVGSVILDNTAGGARAYGGTPDNSDGHSLDVEPDTFDGSVRNTAYFDKITTYGSGNDFTAGTTAAKADNWVLTVNDFESVVTPRTSVAAWVHYGLTVNCNRLQISGLSGVDAQSVILYAGRLNVENFKLSGARTNDFLLLIAQVAEDRPEVRFGHCQIENTGGGGIENRDSRLQIGTFRPRTADMALWNRGLSNSVLADTEVQTVTLENVGAPLGASYAILSSKGGTKVPYLTIGSVVSSDTRPQKLSFIISVGSGASAGLTVSQYSDRSDIPLANWGGPDKFLSTGVGSFICQGTPEAMIPARVGSIARRADGSGNTTFYVKETGTGNTGWAPK